MTNKRLAIIVLMMLLPAVSVFGSQRPNVLMVLIDDMGYSDLGCYGSSIATPNIDRLASNGLRYSSFYNTGRCWTTRASLMTGLYQHQVGKAMSFGEKAPPAYQGNISRELPFVSELLHGDGYRTYHLGKWHLNSRFGEVEHSWPLGRGFDRSYCVVSQNNFFAPWVMRDESEIVTRPKDPQQWPKDFYLTRAITDRALAYLQSHYDSASGVPFFMYLAHTAPHFPLHAPQNVIDKYRHQFDHGWDEERRRRHKRLTTEGIVDADLSPRDPTVPAWSSLPQEDKDRWAQRMAIHAAMIDVIDVQLGRVLDLLEEQGELDNTIVMLLSDNGASAESLTRGDGHDPSAPAGSGRSYLCLEVGWSNAANTPFREHKMWTHEGGIATPFIVHWSKGIRKAGEICHQVGHVIDVLPTIADIVGLQLPENVHYQGRSLTRSFRSPARSDTRVLFWEHVGNKGIRIGDLKAVQEHGKAWELYNLAKDRTETNDLSELIPSMLKPMVRAWQDMADEYGVVEWDDLKEFHPNYSFDYRRK